MLETDTPFHPGEIAVQTRVGVAEMAAKFGGKAIRDHLIDQHRDFYPLLPMVFLGAADDEGRPWASLLAGPPGFAHAPDAGALRLDARPAAGDALEAALTPGRKVGVLGLEWQTRRRNRLAGRVAAADAGGVAIAVEQAFGNCPKYIQTRTPGGPTTGAAAASRRPAFSADDLSLIRAADTLMIATVRPGDSASDGADVSHRGGAPGFVEVEADGALLWADYPGNRFFNTLGNIEATGRAGLLFVDWATGAGLQATGTAEIVWTGPSVDRLRGAERAVRFRATEVRTVPGLLPEAWRLLEVSPYLERL